MQLQDQHQLEVKTLLLLLAWRLHWRPPAAQLLLLLRGPVLLSQLWPQQMRPAAVLAWARILLHLQDCP
jgi:hypothetical protein